jgi:hypothetical protein
MREVSMRQSLIGVIVFTLAIIAWVQQGNAEPLPTKIGACSATTITDIGYRLDTPDSGSAIVYANGGGQVSYDTIPEIHRSRIGDKVKLCLVSLPEDCPPGDDRGETWEAADSQHSCGGA